MGLSKNFGAWWVLEVERLAEGKTNLGCKEHTTKSSQYNTTGNSNSIVVFSNSSNKNSNKNKNNNPNTSKDNSNRRKRRINSNSNSNSTRVHLVVEF